MITILLPTKKRPNNVIRFVDNVLATAENPSDIEICYYLDDDDSLSLPGVQYSAERINTQAIQGNLKIGSQIYNELYRIASGEIFLLAADDIIFNTPKWDALVVDAFNKQEDKIMYVYGEDGFQHGRIGTHGFIHNNWIEILGYVLPTKLSFAYADEWITELAQRVKRNVFLPDLLIEHLHPCCNKAPSDETYRTRAEVSGDHAAFYKSLEGDRVADAKKLQDFIELFK